MRLPTPAALLSATRRVAVRFPESCLSALAAYVFATLALRGSGSFEHSPWWRWVVSAALGIPAGVVLAVIFERRQQTSSVRLLPLRVITALELFGALAGLGSVWNFWSNGIQTKRLLHLSLGIHLVVAFAPFLFRHQANAFWQWNRALFVRFVTAFLFSGVLFAGLGIALAAGKPLFGIDVPGKVYADLWFAIAFLFNTGYFLAGVPADFDELERDDRYPAGLKVFAQYILAPLVVVYLTILSAYLVKVLFTGQWPKGWIGWLVSSVSVAGMLSLLLLHPVRERAGNRWIAIYSRTFYLALLPAIAMLFAAIGKRIGQYGITEDRYFLLVLTSWLAVMAVAYGFRRATDIRWIPITLCLVAFITYSGPWGAYSVSRNNQAARLMNLLERARVLVDGKPVTPAPEVSVAQRKEIASAISYVAGTHGMKALPKPVRLLAGSEARLKMDDRYRWQRGELVARKVMSELGIGYVDPWQTTEMHYVNYYEQPPTLAIDDIAGFRSVVSFQSNPPMKFQTAEGELRIEVNGPARAIRIRTPRGSVWEVPVDSLIRAIDMNPFPPSPDSVRRVRYELGESSKVLGESGDAGEHGRLVIRALSGVVQSDTLDLNVLGGDLYLGPASPAGTPAISR